MNKAMIVGQRRRVARINQKFGDTGAAMLGMVGAIASVTVTDDLSAPGFVGLKFNPEGQTWFYLAEELDRLELEELEKYDAFQAAAWGRDACPDARFRTGGPEHLWVVGRLADLEFSDGEVMV